MSDQVQARGNGEKSFGERPALLNFVYFTFVLPTNGQRKFPRTSSVRSGGKRETLRERRLKRSVDLMSSYKVAGDVKYGVVKQCGSSFPWSIPRVLFERIAR